MTEPAKVVRESTPLVVSEVNQVIEPTVPESTIPATDQSSGQGSEEFDFADFSESLNTDESEDNDSEILGHDGTIDTPAQESIVPELSAPDETLLKQPLVKEPSQPKVAAIQEQELKVSSYTPEQIDQERAKLTQKYEQQYAMTEEEGGEVLQAPDKALPKLAAKMHVQVMESTLVALQQMIPQLMQQEMQRAQAAMSARKAFFDTWPGLDKPEYVEQLTRIGNSYRANNPAAPMDQYIQEVGAMASIVLKVPPGPDGQVSSTVPLKPIAFTPAMPGGGAATLATKPKLNEFETMAIEILESGS